MNASVGDIVYMDIQRVEYVPKHEQIILYDKWGKGKVLPPGTKVLLEIPEERVKRAREG